MLNLLEFINENKPPKNKTGPPPGSNDKLDRDLNQRIHHQGNSAEDDEDEDEDESNALMASSV